MPPKTTGRVNAPKPVNPRKKPVAATQPPRSKTPTTAPSAKSPAPIRASTPSDPIKPNANKASLAATATLVEPPSAAIIKNIHDALTKLREATICSIDEKDRIEADEAEEGGGQSIAQQGKKGKESVKGKDGNAKAHGSELSKNAKEIDKIFERGQSLQTKVFVRVVAIVITPSGSLQDPKSILRADAENWHQWMIADLHDTLQDDLDLSLLLDYLWSILAYVRQSGRYHARGKLGLTQSGTTIRQAGHAYTTVEQRAALSVISVISDAVCQILSALDPDECDQDSAARMQSEEWIRLYIELLKLARGGSLFGLDFSAGIGELLWAAAEHPKYGSKVREFLRDDAVCGWSLLGKLLVEARATNAFLSLSRITVACLPRDFHERKAALEMLVEPHLAQWGMTTRETRNPGGKDKYKALASDVVSYFNRLKDGPQNLPLAYMEFLNHVAKWDTRDMRTCGFALASATLDGKDLCAALKCKEKLLNGEVVIYVDHERLLIKGYSEEGCEEDMIVDYADILSFEQAQPTASGLFELSKKDSVNDAMQIVRIGVKPETSAHFLAEVKKKMAKCRSDTPRRTLTITMVKGARSRTRAPKQTLTDTSEYKGYLENPKTSPSPSQDPLRSRCSSLFADPDDLDLPSGSGQGAALAPAPDPARPDVLVPESDSAGQTHSLKPTATSGTSCTTGSIVVETQHNHVAKHTALEGEGPKDNVSAVAPGDALRAKSGRIVGTRNAKTGIVQSVKRGEKGVVSKPSKQLQQEERSYNDAGAKMEEQPDDANVRDNAGSEASLRVLVRKDSDGEEAAQTKQAGSGERRPKVKSKELEAITPRAQKPFNPPSVIPLTRSLPDGARQSKPAHATTRGALPSDDREEDAGDDEGGHGHDHSAGDDFDRSKAGDDVTGHLEGDVGDGHEGGGGDEKGGNGDDGHSDSDRDHEAESENSGDSSDGSGSKASSKKKTKVCPPDAREMQVPIPSQAPASDRASKSSRVTKTYAKLKGRSPAKADTDNDEDSGDDAEPAGAEPAVIKMTKPKAPTRTSPRKTITPSPRSVVKKVVLPATKLAASTTKQTSAVARRRSRGTANDEDSDGRESQARMPWEGASSKRADHKPAERVPPAGRQPCQGDEENSDSYGVLGDPFTEGFSAVPDVRPADAQQGRQTQMVRDPAPSNGGPRVAITLMAEKEVQTGPSVQTREGNPGTDVGDLAGPAASNQSPPRKPDLQAQTAAPAPTTSDGVSANDFAANTTAEVDDLAAIESLAPAKPPFPTPASHTRPDRRLDQVDKKLVAELQEVWGSAADLCAVSGAEQDPGSRAEKKAIGDRIAAEADEDRASEGKISGPGDVESESDKEPPRKRSKGVSIDTRFMQTKSKSEEPGGMRPRGDWIRKRSRDSEPLEVVSEPARKKDKVEQRMVIVNPYETSLLQITDAINRDIQDQLTRRLRAPAAAARSAQGKLVTEVTRLVNGFVEESLAIQHNVKNARQAADDKYAHLTTFMTDMDSQLTALLHDSKRSRDAGKKGFGADLSSALFAVEEA